jgi:diguanylate cyclase (GGDEF)-like protein
LALVTVAEALKSITRSYDWLCRWGGDEFALILPGASSSASNLAQRIESAIEAMPNRGRPAIGFSVGVARYPRDGSAADELVATADERMYAAKSKERMP